MEEDATVTSSVGKAETAAAIMKSTACKEVRFQLVALGVFAIVRFDALASSLVM